MNLRDESQSLHTKFSSFVVVVVVLMLASYFHWLQLNCCDRQRVSRDANVGKRE